MSKRGKAAKRQNVVLKSNGESLPVGEFRPDEVPGAVIAGFELHHHSGPLPPPSQLAEYDRVHPGLAERIVGMAERQQAPHHATTTRVLDGTLSTTKRGQIFGLVAVGMACVSAVFIASFGAPKVAGAIVLVGLASLAGAFIVQHRKEREGPGQKKSVDRGQRG